MVQKKKNNGDDGDNSSDKAKYTNGDVKSTAVVKYTVVQSPTAFDLLRSNTDLSKAPTNWLSSSAESYGLRFTLPRTTGFSSFRMADMFPDCVGEVDVISDARHIKSLLKLSYSREPISLVVHRVKRTLLIDEFDINKYLTTNNGSEWDYLRNLIKERVFSSMEDGKTCSTNINKCRDALQEEILMSKFLHYSLRYAQPKSTEPCAPKQPFEKKQRKEQSFPCLPDPNLENELDDLGAKHTFSRHMIWTFEDIRMLLGTDMPIFGGGTHPCVSLRLNDMSKPISVLTGIDYWLDNLMCNVPEVAMCYHINGMVKKYEMIKTEDLPFMENSSFSPTLIRDVAQNILAFLKSKATKAGHTYWLLKGKEDEVVKLYDLTSLYRGGIIENDYSPFATPVGLLLYRVARNMHTAGSNFSRNSLIIRTLLKNCIKLLPKEKYPHIVASAHYMFSNSLVPLNTDPDTSNLDSRDEIMMKDRKKKSYNKNDLYKNTVTVKTLSISHTRSTPLDAHEDCAYEEEDLKMIGNVQLRCEMALANVLEGLKCLLYFDDIKPTMTSDENEINTSETRESEVTNTPGTVPLPYYYHSQFLEQVASAEKEKQRAASKARKVKKKGQKKKEDTISIGSILCKLQIETIPTWDQPPAADDLEAWEKHLKLILYEKACLVYVTLARHEFNSGRYGDSLKHTKYVLQSRIGLENAGYENKLLSYLLGRSGDCCLYIYREWLHAKKFDMRLISDTTTHDELYYVMELDKMSSYKGINVFLSKINCTEDIMNNSLLCYNKALEIEPTEVEKRSLMKRLGNVLNELSSYYMMMMVDELKISTKERMTCLISLATSHLNSSLEMFKSLKDDGNLALLYSNYGKLFRIMAHNSLLENGLLLMSSKELYVKAIDFYQTSLSTLGSRRLNPEIWDTVTWQLSTALMNAATLTQDYISYGMGTYSEQAERGLTESFSKALKYCDLETPGPRQVMYQFRAAEIHRRLATLYFNSFKMLTKESSRRMKVYHLAIFHYNSAYKLYDILDSIVPYFKMRLEHVAILEKHGSDLTNNGAKIKVLQSAIDIIANSRKFLALLIDKRKGDGHSQTSDKARRLKKLSNVEKSSRMSPEATLVIINDNDCTDSLENFPNREEAKENDVLLLVEAKFQYLLRTVIKLISKVSSQSNQVKMISSLIPKYKEIYSVLLRKTEYCTLEEHLYAVITQYQDDLILQ